jgi:hypothetical protein
VLNTFDDSNIVFVGNLFPVLVDDINGLCTVNSIASRVSSRMCSKMLCALFINHFRFTFDNRSKLWLRLFKCTKCHEVNRTPQRIL